MSVCLPAVGCEDVRAPQDGWVRRHDNVALIGCGVSDEIKWRLTCKQNSWQGKIGNCTAGIALSIIAVIAFLVGAVILFVGVVCIKRRMRRENPYSEAGEAMQRYDSTPTSRKPGGEDKWSAKPTSPVRPVTSPNPQETNINENEYASMRLLPPLPANDYRRQVMPAQLQQYAFPPPAAYHVTRDVYSPDHVYESPESMRKDNVRFSSGECPEYFDLDMQVRTPNTCTHVSGQCTCAGRPHSASLKGSAVHAGEPRSSNHVSV
ncbi:hypothetical protein NP493_1072g01053 [Ridgeia piscesae]|uniref:Uncharacterized protein n=1 Tax=Ridgeia piscesae TaxID=27915 RepID=A0AAD9KIZ7_RIDPI|nr:hypothetical protein NP493_1072g01053 [Ridgeia piscesae]